MYLILTILLYCHPYLTLQYYSIVFFMLVHFFYIDLQRVRIVLSDSYEK